MDDRESVHSLADTIMDPGSNSDSDRTSSSIQAGDRFLNPRCWHATYPWWDGHRIVLVAFHTRSTSRLAAEQLLLLNGLLRRPARPDAVSVSVRTAQPSSGALDGGDDLHSNNGESREGCERLLHSPCHMRSW